MEFFWQGQICFPKAFFLKCRKCSTSKNSTVLFKKKKKTNQNRCDRNEERWHFFHRRSVREVSVEVIIRIGSRLWDTLYLSREQTAKGEEGNLRHLTGLHATGVQSFHLSLCSWLLGTESQYSSYVVWAGETGCLLIMAIDRLSAKVSLQLPINAMLMQANEIGGVYMTSWTQKKTQANNADVTTSIRTWLQYSVTSISQLMSMLISFCVNCICEPQKVGFKIIYTCENRKRCQETQNANENICSVLKKRCEACVWHGVCVCGKACKGSLTTFILTQCIMRRVKSARLVTDPGVNRGRLPGGGWRAPQISSTSGEDRRRSVF